jgi:quercetin dioxygenase-like cupin family protein
MNKNADFSQRVLLHGDELPWIPSPTAGVERRMLDRIGDEVARATSLVRYAPGSLFPEHGHAGGEEFIVVEGVFQDEHGDYPVGTYVRNPPGTRHRPGSAPGCTIFVKLWQFQPDDREQLAIDMGTLELVDAPDHPGVARAVLFENEHETVRAERWQPGCEVSINAPDGAEVLLLSGSCVESGEPMRELSWLRIPPGGNLHATAGEGGAFVWLKLGDVGATPGKL